MNNITIGLDRDGTILHDIGKPIKFVNEVNPIEGSLEAIKMLRDKNYNVVILSNQPGIHTNEISIPDVQNVHQILLEKLGAVGCTSISGIYYSTTSFKKDIYAKPNIGMFQRAEQECDLKFKGGAFVGDRISDLKAALRVGALPVLVKTGKGLETEKMLSKSNFRQIKNKTTIVDNLYDFANALPWNT
jgi:D-glycero-D-manno-heptose 1,7-bisphosphate phosphatase